jgi:hypothetical protein
MIRKIVLAGVFGMTTSAQAQVFDNKSVIALRDAGLGESTIITKINSLPCSYDVSTDSLIALKKARVTDEVIAAMVSRCSASYRAQGLDNGSVDPLTKHAPGIYLFAEGGSAKRLLLLRPAVGAGNRISGNGSLLFPLKAKLTVSQPHSQNHADSGRPTFYFYFDASDKNVSDFGLNRSIAAQSPNEFSLVRFKIRNNAREIETGRLATRFSLNFQLGVKGNDTIAFTVEEVGDGIFRVVVAEEMVAGEYAFVFAGQGGRSRLYDFAIVERGAPDPHTTAK